MNERGVTNPPTDPLISDLQKWRNWGRWFSLVTQASAKIQVLEATCNPTQVNADTTSEQTFTVTGVLLDRDVVLSVTKPTHTAGIGIVNARVSADDTIAITFINPTAGNIDPPSQTYVFVVMRK
jgi:hypothetical protein